MKLTQYLNSNKAEALPIKIDEQDIEGVFFRRLNAGEGLQLKDSFADLIEASGGKLDQAASDGDVAKAEEAIRKSLNSDQLKALFRQQALFTFLHLANRDGSRLYTDRKSFDEEVPEEFVQAFYAAGSKLKADTEPGGAEAEKNSSTPAG